MAAASSLVPISQRSSGCGRIGEVDEPQRTSPTDLVGGEPLATPGLRASCAQAGHAPTSPPPPAWRGDGSPPGVVGRWRCRRGRHGVRSQQDDVAAPPAASLCALAIRASSAIRSSASSEPFATGSQSPLGPCGTFQPRHAACRRPSRADARRPRGRLAGAPGSRLRLPRHSGIRPPRRIPRPWPRPTRPSPAIRSRRRVGPPQLLPRRGLSAWWPARPTRQVRSSSSTRPSWMSAAARTADAATRSGLDDEDPRSTSARAAIRPASWGLPCQRRIPARFSRVIPA